MKTPDHVWTTLDHGLSLQIANWVKDGVSFCLNELIGEARESMAKLNVSVDERLCTHCLEIVVPAYPEREGLAPRCLGLEGEQFAHNIDKAYERRDRLTATIFFSFDSKKYKICGSVLNKASIISFDGGPPSKGTRYLLFGVIDELPSESVEHALDRMGRALGEIERRPRR